MTDLTRRSALAGAAAFAASPLLSTGTAHAAAPQIAKQAPGYYRYKLGDYEVTVVTDGTRPTPIPDNFVRNASRAEVNASLESFFMPTERVVFRFTPVVINTGSKLVVFDTGLGAATYAQSKGAAGQFHTNLAASGIDTKHVDAVVISHFHADHINGLVDADNKPAFANAEVLVPAAEWAYWMDDGNMSRASDAAKSGFQNVRRVFGALGGKVTQYEANKEIIPSVTSIATPGHTPGHTSFRVVSGKHALIVQADVTAGPSWLFIRNPAWQPIIDTDSALAVQSRRALYDQAVADRLLVQVFHNPFPGVGYFEKAGDGYRFEPAPWDSSI